MNCQCAHRTYCPGRLSFFARPSLLVGEKRGKRRKTASIIMVYDVFVMNYLTITLRESYKTKHVLTFLVFAAILLSHGARDCGPGVPLVLVPWDCFPCTPSGASAGLPGNQPGCRRLSGGLLCNADPRGARPSWNGS